MKKLLVILCLAFLACPSWAGKEGGVRFGLLGGFTSSSTNVEQMKLSSVSLYHAGVALHVPVGPTFAVQFQLQYQVKGATLDKMDTSPASLQSLETKVGYLELPIQFQLRIPLPVVRPYLFGEPFLGYALNLYSKSLEDEVKDFSKANIQRMEYGLGLGGGVDVWKIQVSARYFWNFGSLCADDGKVSTNAVAETVTSAFKDKRHFNGFSVTAVLFF